MINLPFKKSNIPFKSNGLKDLSPFLSDEIFVNILNLNDLCENILNFPCEKKPKSDPELFPLSSSEGSSVRLVRRGLAGCGQTDVCG